MAFFEWITANWELICVFFGIIVNAVCVVYNLIEAFCSEEGSAKAWIALLEAAREYEIEAERFSTYSGAEKLQYVLTRLRALAAEFDHPFDEEKLVEQIRADIAFSKAVNAGESDGQDS